MSMIFFDKLDKYDEFKLMSMLVLVVPVALERQEESHQYSSRVF